jgi:hypothetical protein
MIQATAVFFVPRVGGRGYVIYGSGLISDFLHTKEEALLEIGSAYILGVIDRHTHAELEQAINASSLPSDGTDFFSVCEP